MKRRSIVTSLCGVMAVLLMDAFLKWPAARSQQSPEPKRELWLGMKTGARLTDEKFFTTLDLDLQALDRVKRHVVTADWPGARRELYRYVRDKFRNANFYSPPKINGDRVPRKRRLAGRRSLGLLDRARPQNSRA